MTDPNNNIDLMYFHGKTIDGCRYTLSGVVKDDNLQLGIALCSDLDHFNKAKGRDISTGRVLNQRPTHSGRNLISLYSDHMGDEHRGKAGYPENYFVGQEIKVFTAYVKNYNHFTKTELQKEFGLYRQTTNS